MLTFSLLSSQLLKYTEDKLFTLLTPAEQQKILRLKTQASPLDIVEAESSLTAWEDKIQNTDRLLSKRLNHGVTGASDQDLHKIPPALKTKKLPPVRGGVTVISIGTEDDNTERHDKSEDVAHRLRISGTLKVFYAYYLQRHCALGGRL